MAKKLAANSLEYEMQNRFLDLGASNRELMEMNLKRRLVFRESRS